MAPSAAAPHQHPPSPLPLLSKVQLLLKPQSTVSSSTRFPQARHQLDLAVQIQHNLQHQHNWSQLHLYAYSPLTQQPLPRPVISGLPPKRVYIHPDEQIELLKYEKTQERHDGQAVDSRAVGSAPEKEWVLPAHVGEQWTLKGLAGIFDALGTVPPRSEEEAEEEGDKEVGWQWRGEKRQKRLLMATLHDDSTVVYYIVHDGIVKPRQN